MNMILSGVHPNDGLSFRQFILNKKNYLLIVLIGTIIQLIVFKLLYPFPDFISDSYNYIETNLLGLKVNLWPIGYSKFIALIHIISSSHVFLVCIQYVLFQLALLYFFFTVTYLYTLSRTNTNLLLVFLCFNPMFLYLSNCVLSDALFGMLSLTLFTQYLWMYHRPTVSNLVIQALLIGAAFVVRYTAIYYPIVSIVAILLSTYKLPFKLVGMVLPWLLIIPFILYTQQKTRELTGTAEFSVFGGWQIANNALYMYGHIDVDNTTLPEDTRELDLETKRYFKLKPPSEDDLAKMPGTFFLKTQDAILKPYMKSKLLPNEQLLGFQEWGRVSPIYNKYGTYLMKKYPIPFARYYLLLNTKNYFFPHLEKFGNYNLGMKTVWPAVPMWFQMPNNEVHTNMPKNYQAMFFFLYLPCWAMLNIFFFFLIIYTLIIGKLNTTRFFRNSILIAVTFLLVNFGFSVFATPVVMRYQVIPMIILFFFTLYLTEHIFESERKTAINKS